MFAPLLLPTPLVCRSSRRHLSAGVLDCCHGAQALPQHQHDLAVGAASPWQRGSQRGRRRDASGKLRWRRRPAERRQLVRGWYHADGSDSPLPAQNSSSWTLAICVPDYAASPVYLANVSLTLAVGIPESPTSRVERVFTNWSHSPAAANLTGFLWVDLVTPYTSGATAGSVAAPYRCAYPLAPYEAVVLRLVGVDQQPC